MQRSSGRRMISRLALATVGTLLLASVAGAGLWSVPGRPQETKELAKGEAAPFPGVLYTLDAEAVLLSRIENLEAAVAHYQETVAELEGARAELREELFDLQVADGISSSLAESRGADLNRCESALAAQRWVTRGVGVACGLVLVLRGSLTNPVPR